MAERLRAGGAEIPGFYTATGVGTPIAEGKEQKEFKGRTYIFEGGIVGILRLWKLGKLIGMEIWSSARQRGTLIQ